MQVWIRKELNTLDGERCPSFSASYACERKVFCPECLIKKILSVIGFFEQQAPGRAFRVDTALKRHEDLN
jgi:hypothetical protein